MKVLFKRNWLTPNHTRIRVRGKAEIYDVPEEWKDQLPSTAKIVDEAFIIETENPEKVPETLSELGNYLAADHERQAVELAGKKEEEADATIAAHKAMRAKRNRREGAARAREALAAKKAKEKENVKMA
jgi:hypothetical protein